METAVVTTPKQPEKNIVKTYFQREDVRKKFEELLGKRNVGFITSLLSLVNQSENLLKATPESVFTAAMMAATLDLPINPNLAFAYIIPYAENYEYTAPGKDGKPALMRGKRYIAQFQMGYKGFIQLAERTGQYKTISAAPIYEGQLIEENPLTGFIFDFTKKSTKVIGYAAYFSLINGFEKTLYMSLDEISAHAKKFSKTFGKDTSVWKKDFDSMAQKTALKLLLSKYGMLSVDMQKAIIADQSLIKDVDTMDISYIDNPENAIPIAEKKEEMRNNGTKAPELL